MGTNSQPKDQEKAQTDSNNNTMNYYVSSYNLSKKAEESFVASNSTSGNWDGFTGIKNDSPEIIALFDFMPCYNDDGTLNRVGEFLEIKQQAILTSAMTAIKSTIESENSAVLNSLLTGNKNDLIDFCDSYSLKISHILSQIDLQKSKMSFVAMNSPLKENLYGKKLANGMVINDNLISQMADLSSVYSISNHLTYLNWTKTKQWMQAFIELKSLLEYGSFNGLLNNFYKNPDITSSDETDKFKITKPRNLNLNFYFNDKQSNVPQFLSLLENNNIDINQAKKSLKDLLSTKSYSLYNIKVEDLDSSSFGKISFLLSRELLYSKALGESLSLKDGLKKYSYPVENLASANNSNLFDYLIGVPANDITDFQENQNNFNFNNYPSAISLLHHIDQEAAAGGDRIEILTFEDKYVTDDIGSPRPQSVISPGSKYFIENVLNLKRNISNSGKKEFDLSNVQTLISDKLFPTKYALDLIRNNFIFGAIPSREYNKLANPTYEFQANIFNEICHPITLLRKFELLIQSSSGLLNKDGSQVESGVLGPKLLSKNNSDDLSAVFISAALEDSSKELLSLLFLFLFLKINEKIRNNSNQESAKIFQEFLSKLLVSKQYLGVYIQEGDKINIDDLEGTLYSIVLDDINDILETKINLLNSFVSFFVDDVYAEMISFFGEGEFKYVKEKNGTFFTNYSGIALENVAAAMFHLFFMLVHSANPERILKYIPAKFLPGSQYQYDPEIDGNLAPSVDSAFEIKLERNSHTTEALEDIFDDGSTLYIPIYQFDYDISNAESLIYDEIKNSILIYNRVYYKIQDLFTSLENFKKTFSADNSSQSLIDDSIEILKNRGFGEDEDMAEDFAQQLFSNEQLKLISSKLHGISSRLAHGSALKYLSPYFYDFLLDADGSFIENLLPLEDFHVVAWKFFLNNFLKKVEYRESPGKNKKIISVGIPRGLQNRLNGSTEASKLLVDSFPSLVNVNIHMTDLLRPGIVYKPLRFLFKTNYFPIRTIDYNLSGYKTTKENDIFKNYENFFKYMNVEDFLGYTPNDSYYSFLGEEFLGFSEKELHLLSYSHDLSFFLEQYIRFTTGVSFDEHAFSNYDRSLSKLNFFNIAEKSNIRTNKYFEKNVLLSDISEIKKDLITPKKFDRVFHMILDPDDFEVDKVATQELESTYGIDPLNYYKGNNYLIEDDNGIVKRNDQQSSNEISVDSYYVTLSSYSSSEQLVMYQL